MLRACVPCIVDASDSQCMTHEDIMPRMHAPGHDSSVTSARPGNSPRRGLAWLYPFLWPWTLLRGTNTTDRANYYRMSQVLTYVGAEYLIMSTEVKEMVLKTVALQFVIKMDNVAADGLLTLGISHVHRPYTPKALQR
jgi:hypothetical protein